MLQKTSVQIMPLLREIRNLTNLQDSVEKKFADIIKIIAKDVRLSVVACYVSLDDTYLEKIAAYAENFSGTIKNTVRYDEGVVGEAAKTACTLFEEVVCDGVNFTFMAIPLIKRNKANGVLLLCAEDKQIFDEENNNMFETLAMFIAEQISSPDVGEWKKHNIQEKGISDKDKIKGQSLNKSFGIGYAVVHRRAKEIKHIFAEDKEKELAKLSSAFVQMNNDLDEKFTQSKLGIGEHADILDAYKMFARDKGWYKRISDNINGGLTAEASAERAYEDMWKRLSVSQDVYLKERLHDLRDVTDRLISYILDEQETNKINTKDCDIIIVADTMGPADLMDYDYTKIRGLIIENGTPTMHVAIVAKALNIPVLIKIKGVVEELKNGELLAIDGESGYVYINPSHEIQQKIQQKSSELKTHLAKNAEMNNLETITQDGVKIGLNMNVGLPFDLDYLDTTNCDGVGLYRTEIPFMSSQSMPNVEIQEKNYRNLLDKAKDKRVIFRSLDVGSDKLLPYWSDIAEENPAIGWRSIRITLDRRAILRKQMTAFLKAAAGKDLYVMFPMVADLYEFLEAKETLMIEYEKEKNAGNRLPKNIYVGLMIEVPSIVFQLDEVLKYADFISVGTNDLAQFMFACDRGNPRLIGRYDVLSMPFLRVMREIVEKAEKAGVYCSVCGEMASNPIEALALLGLGYKHLSVSGSVFGDIKAMIRSTNLYALKDYMQVLLHSEKIMLRPQLLAYAFDHGIEIY